MTALTEEGIFPLDRWNNNYISPGVVGSVGDVNMQVRLRQTNPNMRMRYDPTTALKNEVRLGSNVTDGQVENYKTHGGCASVMDSNWGGRRRFKTARGWVYQDLRVADRTIEPYLSSVPNYAWTNQLATVYRAMSNGSRFLPLPGEYALPAGQTPRFGNSPAIQVAGATGVSRMTAGYDLNGYGSKYGVDSIVSNPDKFF